MLKPFIILISAIAGFYFLFMPADRLFDNIKRPMFGLKLPIPHKGTLPRKLLLCLYRFFGLVAMGFCALVLFTILTKR